jgi:hypothetical protein
MSRIIIVLVLAWMIVTQALAAEVLPDLIPPGSYRPLKIGDEITLNLTRFFEQPDLQSEYHYSRQLRKAIVISSENNFYQLNVLALDEADGLQEVKKKISVGQYFVYRSELSLRNFDSANSINSDTKKHQVLSEILAADIPLKGDTLLLANPTLYTSQDLLAEHQAYNGSVKLVVVTSEDESGFVKVETPAGDSVYIYRCVLEENKRRDTN